MRQLDLQKLYIRDNLKKEGNHIIEMTVQDLCISLSVATRQN